MPLRINLDILDVIWSDALPKQDVNGGGPSVRLRKRQRTKKSK